MGKLGVAGVAILAVALVAALEPVNREPFAAMPYAVRTQAALEGLASAGNGGVRSGELRAGFGKVKLTPTVGAPADEPEKGEFVALPLAGYGDRRGRSAEGVLDDLWVKAVAWEVGGRTGVVVTADALIIPREVADLALETLERDRGLERGQVFFGATHTHCGIGGWGKGWVAEIFAGGFVPGSRVWMAGQLVKAAEVALGDLRPASAGSGHFDAPDLTRNRLVGDRGRLDSRFSLLVVRQAEGDLAVVGSYSAHATVLSGRVMKFSGDYPGAWQRGVESATGGMAMFLGGAMGSHSPRPPEGGVAGMERMGAELAEATVRAVGGIALTNRLAWGIQAVEVELPDLQFRVADGMRLRPWLARRLLPLGSTTWLQYLRLGDAVWLSTPCDYSGELAVELAEATAGTGVMTTVTSFNGDYVGYVVPSRYYDMNTYETRTMSFFGPQLPDYFDSLLIGLVRVATAGGDGER